MIADGGWHLRSRRRGLDDHSIQYNNIFDVGHAMSQKGLRIGSSRMQVTLARKGTREGAGAGRFDCTGVRGRALLKMSAQEARYNRD